MKIVISTLCLVGMLAVLPSCNSSNGGGRESTGSGPSGATTRGPGGTGSGSNTEENCTPNQTASDLEMSPIKQEEAVWCWAACGQMVMQKIGDTSISQCDEANKALGLDDCCGGVPRPDPCIQGGVPPFDIYRFRADSTQDSALTWADLTGQIDCKKKPFCSTWRWIDTAGRPLNEGHMTVISGYKVEGGIQYVYILNPDFDDVLHARWQPYSSYVSGANYIHWNDYYNIKRK